MDLTRRGCGGINKITRAGSGGFHDILVATWSLSGTKLIEDALSSPMVDAARDVEEREELDSEASPKLSPIPLAKASSRSLIRAGRLLSERALALIGKRYSVSRHTLQGPAVGVDVGVSRSSPCVPDLLSSPHAVERTQQPMMQTPVTFRLRA